ncbi:MAG TPA: phosphoenolpyruvate mutase [Alphaproteobacteria bacterium]|nr:phosphoenolpyruvate mutase [Alphaproteobacteria bacterium]
MPLNGSQDYARNRSKAARFRALLESPELGFCMEAHDGLSAKGVEEAGFEAIWGSGLSISTALGVRDRNEASWTQVVDVLEFMSDATSIPIMLDGDTGYGDFNNFRRLVRKLCQRDIAAVCIEDKIFPKTNSFLDGGQALADIDEFSGKIKAGKDSRTNDDFSIIARIEALIAGYGMDEALRRAEAYHAAGADGILIHSRRSTADEVLEFARQWAGRAPLIIVPTKYYATPTQRFRDAGISLVIWANHNLRASLQAMRETSRQIYREQSLADVEGRVADLGSVFTIAGNRELAEAEELYLPGRPETNAIILAATRGSKLKELTEDKPKCMLDVRGEPLLRRLTRSLNEAGISSITVVGGYKARAITPNGLGLGSLDLLLNEDFETTGEVASLAKAVDRLEGHCVISYGDILFRGYILDQLLRQDADIALVIDASNAGHPETSGKTPDLAICSAAFSEDVMDDQTVMLEAIGDGVEAASAHGQWVGLAKLSPRGAKLVRDEIGEMEKDGTLNAAALPELLNRIVGKGERPAVVYVSGHWTDVNDAFGLARARNFL